MKKNEFVKPSEGLWPSKCLFLKVSRFPHAFMAGNGRMALKAFAAILFILLLPALATAQTRKPVIGISSDCKKGKLTVSETYTKAVLLAGGIPMVLPQVEDSLAAAAVLEAVDGLILSGGEDINPLLYFTQPHYGLGKVNPGRDRTEISLLKAADAMKLPVLGICRGEQLVNVFYGGTLYQDLPTEFEPAASNHLQSFGGTTPSHLVYPVKGTHFSRLVGDADSLYVNSFHHQAVKEVAPGFKVTAQSPDGVVEGIEGLPALNVVAVQFHPEYFAMQGDERWLPLFRDLMARASAYQAQKEGE